MVVQEYLDRPFLINKLKFDLRLYVAVTSFDPLRVYTFEEGLARFSTEQYRHLTRTRTCPRQLFRLVHSAPSSCGRYRPPREGSCGGGLENHFMHLTNYSINKHSSRDSSPRFRPCLSHRVAGHRRGAPS